MQQGLCAGEEAAFGIANVIENINALSRMEVRPAADVAFDA
jgi:hypothetical protein